MYKHLLLPLAFIAMLLSCTDAVQENDVKVENQQKLISPQLQNTLSKMQSAHSGVSFRKDIFGPRRVPDLAKQDAAKIGAADGIGALQGIPGGLPLILGRAASSSLVKAAKIYAWKYIKGYLTDHGYLRIPSICNGSSMEDSIGYYHNKVVHELYQMNPGIYELPTRTVFNKVDSVIRRMDSEYAQTTYTVSVYNDIIKDLNTLRNIDTDESMSFVEYIDALEAAFPNDADFIEVIAQYIFDVNYANADIDNYTNEVLWIIGASELSDQDAIRLRRAILVSYSSILYNTSLTFTQL